MRGKWIKWVWVGMVSITLVVLSSTVRAQTLNFDFNTASVPIEIQPAIVEAVSQRQPDILAGGTFFIVGVFHQIENLGYGTIGAAIGNQSPDWNGSIQFVVYQEQDVWHAALEGTPEYENVASHIPELDRSSNSIQAQATDFKFPWHASQTWCYTRSWHNGEWSVDFAPSPSVPVDERWFRSSSDGYLTLVCNDGYQAFARVQNGTLGNMRYGHMASATIPGGIVNTNILQGQQLGRAYNGTQGAGWYDIGQSWPWPACTPNGTCNWSTGTGCCELQYMTACGAGTGPHSHWTLPGPNTTVDGWTIGTDGIWRKSGESDRGTGSCFASSNTGDNTPPTISFSAPAAYQWYNTDQTISWSITDDLTGVRGYKAAWDQTPPGGGEIPASSGSTTLGAIGQGQHTLYVQAWDNAGNASGVVSAGWFGYDVTAPTGSLLLNNNASTSHTALVYVNATASDAHSGVYQIRLRDAGGAWTDWLPYAARTLWQLPAVTGQTHTVEVQFKDRAGNTSTVYQDAIALNIYPARPASSGYRLARSTWGGGGNKRPVNQLSLAGHTQPVVDDRSGQQRRLPAVVGLLAVRK